MNAIPWLFIREIFTLFARGAFNEPEAFDKSRMNL